MSVSRRECLSLLLGAPLAAEGCRRPRREVPGAIRGAAVSVGHRLRDATIERAASGPVERVAVAIVGAGPSGLSAAWRLERLGESGFVLFDLEPQAGGTSAYGTDGVVPYPWGAHYVPEPTADGALATLLDEMGVLEARAPGAAPRAKEELRVREPQERLFVDGRWRPGLWPTAIASDADHAQLQRFEAEVDAWAKFRDERGRRAFALPMRRGSDDARVTELDRLSAARWLDDHGLTCAPLRWFVEYACRDDYGLDLAHTSAWAMLFYFAARKADAGGDSAPFVAWPEGNGRIVRHLADVAGRRLRLGRLVTDVVPADDGVELAVLDVSSGTLSRVLAEHVIVALPKFVVPRVLRPWREQPPAYLAEFTYSSWLVANLHLSRRPESRGAPMAWDNVLFDSPSLGYVAATHQSMSDRGPTVLTYYLPLVDGDPAAARRRLLEVDQRSAADALLVDLGRAHADLESCVERIDVWRWGHAMVRPTPGFVWGAARRRAAEPLGRVHFAHSDLSGLALFEEAQDRGVQAAEAVLRARGREFGSLG